MDNIGFGSEMGVSMNLLIVADLAFDAEDSDPLDALAEGVFIGAVQWSSAPWNGSISCAFAFTLSISSVATLIATMSSSSSSSDSSSSASSLEIPAAKGP